MVNRSETLLDCDLFSQLKYIHFHILSSPVITMQKKARQALLPALGQILNQKSVVLDKLARTLGHCILVLSFKSTLKVHNMQFFQCCRGAILFYFFKIKFLIFIFFQKLFLFHQPISILRVCGLLQMYCSIWKSRLVPPKCVPAARNLRTFSSFIGRISRALDIVKIPL